MLQHVTPTATFVRSGRRNILLGRLLDLSWFEPSAETVVFGAKADELMRSRRLPKNSPVENIEQLGCCLALRGLVDLRIDTTLPAFRDSERRMKEFSGRIQGTNLTGKVLARELSVNDLLREMEASLGPASSNYRKNPGWIVPEGETLTVFPDLQHEDNLNALCGWINGVKHLPIMCQASTAYCQILNIHAFSDGNGRLARAVASAILSARLFEANDNLLTSSAVAYVNSDLFTAAFRRFDRDGNPSNLLILLIAALVKSSFVVSTIMNLPFLNEPSKGQT